MPGRALLIGGAVEDLHGVETDVNAMREALTARGLTVDPAFVLTGKEATRAAVLAAYERLIALAQPGEPAVVYYSGHGGRALPSAVAPRSGSDPLDLQFIVPYDFDQSGPGDFRGITSVELSVLQYRLTRRTDNVVSIFDCCHSGRLSRQQFRVKATRQRVTSYEELSAHIERMRAEGLDAESMPAAGNTRAVRIVACAPEQLAFEYPGVGGKPIGVLTEALTMALHATVGQPVSWATLLDGIRLRISSLVTGQRPEAEGPSRRLLFETARDDHPGSLPVTDLGDGRLQLDCAPVLGVRPGDVFAIVSPSKEKVGDLTVEPGGPLFSQGTVTLATGVTAVPAGARAVRVTPAARQLVVSVPADVPRDPALDRALQDSPLVRVAEDGEPWAAALRIEEDGAVTVADRVGPLHPPPSGGATDAATVLGDLEKLARTEALRTLDVDAQFALGADVACEWGLVADGRRQPLPDFGAVVRAGQNVYISVRNNRDDPVYVTLVDIGVSGRITVLTNFAPSGVRLSRSDRQEYLFGYQDFPGVLKGQTLGWPAGLDPTHARTETILIFVTSEPQDFGALGQPGVARGDFSGGSRLASVLDRIGTGRTRDLDAAGSMGGSYDIHKLEFELEPASGPGSFLIEEVPAPVPSPVPPAVLTPRGAPAVRTPHDPAAGPPVPTAVAVRLDELVIHRNRAWFGGTDVRVDAIVLTGAQGSPQPAFRARTQRFSRIRDGEPLPLDRMLLFHGPVADYLDIALWVSRDTAGAGDLGELLSDEVAAFEMQEALAKAGGALTGLPYAAAAAAMVGVGAVVVNVAYRLLRGTVSDVIGLYRGSMLAGEAFGVGRHPKQDLRQVQDFSFAYSIDDVS